MAELPEREVASRSLLYAHVRRAGYQLQDSSIRKAADDLVVAGRFVEVYGKRGAIGYRAVASTSAEDEAC